MQRRIGAVVEDQLGGAGAVAEIDEDQVAEIAAAVDPAHEHHLFACIVSTKLSAHVRAPKIT